ncbi:MAG: histone deacetylase family protein [Burkholderiales bacterium]
MQTALITHEACMRHEMGAHHPECPERLSAIEDRLIASGLAAVLARHVAPLATAEQLERVHPRDYIEGIRRVAPAEGLIHLDPDTAMSPGTWEASLRAAGAVVLAADLVLTKQVANAFCSVRPPGHHAMRARSMGFCLFNNVAVGVMHAIAQHGLTRIAVIDFDVHHGNGTEDIFSDDERVLMASTFQHPFYPYSGTGHAAPNMLNVPLAAGSGGPQFRKVVEDKWLPALAAFAPEMIFISAGFDAHADDDMAMLRFADADYRWVTERLMGVATRFSSGRIASVLEGGYDLPALGRSVEQHVRALAGL